MSVIPQKGNIISSLEESSEETKQVAGPKLVNKPVDILPLKDLELKCDKETEAFEVLKVFLNVY